MFPCAQKGTAMVRTSPVTTSAIIERDTQFVADAIKIRYTPFVLAGGAGSRLFDAEGNSFLDFSSGTDFRVRAR